MSVEQYCLKTIARLLLLPWLLASGNAVLALSSDSEQPIEIEANAAELDDEKGVTVYTGNVIVTQGSIRMTGDKMTVYYTEDKDLDTVVMVGQPATYRQLPDNSDVYDEAEARRMEFYELQNLIVLIDDAEVRQEGLRFSGNRIEYDTLHSKIKARGKTKTQKSAADDETGTEEGGRVKIILQPKKKEGN